MALAKLGGLHQRIVFFPLGPTKPWGLNLQRQVLTYNDKPKARLLPAAGRFNQAEGFVSTDH